MTYRIETTRLATQEVWEAFKWYEAQSDGLGDRFIEDMTNFYVSLLANPFTHSYCRGRTRQGVLRKFPYTIVYEVIDNTILVYNVFMNRQDPEKKRTR